MKLSFQILFGAAAIGAILAAAGTVAGANRIRFAVSNTVFGEINDNDARTALKGWVEEIMRDTSTKIEYDSGVISTGEQVVQKIRAHEVDSFAFTMIEYNQVSALVDKTIIVDGSDAQGGDEYLILVHADSGIHDLTGLRGRSLIQYRQPRMCVAGPWLETILAAANQGSSDSFFVRKTDEVKLARTILPVYFRQADACLAPRRGFEAMRELNPQLTKKLLVLAASPRIYPLFVGFHKDTPLARRQSFAEALTGLYRSQSGRQALMFFQSARLVQSNTSNLKSGVDLITAYERLKAKTGVRK